MLVAMAAASACDEPQGGGGSDAWVEPQDAAAGDAAGDVGLPDSPPPGDAISDLASEVSDVALEFGPDTAEIASELPDETSEVAPELPEDVVGIDVGGVDTAETSSDDTSGAGIGEVCTPGEDDCHLGLVCCYPCGIPDCEWTCQEPCDPSEPWCTGGCPMLP